MAILMRCTLLVTWAPIFRSFRRMVPQVALASSVWARPMRRSAVSTMQAIEANQSRYLLVARGAVVTGAENNRLPVDAPAALTRRHILALGGANSFNRPRPFAPVETRQ